MMNDVEKVGKKLVSDIRQDFPILQEMVNGHRLVYLDNGATTQKPISVIDAISEYYRQYNSNIHRGVHTLSQLATDRYELARNKVKNFINAQNDEEIIFVRGTTEGINLVAQSYARNRLKKGDEVIISTMEHHSNIVPWQMVCEQTQSILKIIPIDENGVLLMDDYEALLSDKTKIVSIVHQSNTLGTINPVKQITKLAHDAGAIVLVDGAQSAPHLSIDVQDIDCDFFAFSGHKVCGPTGVGILYGKQDILEEMPPYQGGGDMIRSVSFEKTTYNDLPYKFEAGTPNIAGGIGLGVAIDYLTNLGMENIALHEKNILSYAKENLRNMSGIRIIGDAEEYGGVVSFVMDAAHPHDIGTILDSEGVAIRTGHHCTQPLMDRFDIPATARASISFYNTKDDVDRFLVAVDRVSELFG
ncbi:MAG TPA: cysteine desulfurase CsdA [Dehalococcoidia bacterium]|jgi:cysteine desulfurase / selenocysteine lyase|nr:cysteine desulfurase CsdA [Dehalococcoidia bacterium]|tara:strand:- start:934 stop:2178 length:1245 start_codon:yes stop_codon:yes gene_type:complete